MKKGQILEGIVERLEFPNKGIVRVEEVRGSEDGESSESKKSSENKENNEDIGVKGNRESKEDNFCLVKNVLPGQKISFCVQKKRNGKAEGRLLEVLQRAENEVESRCPHFESCGGCIYHGLPYEEQCRLKQEQVRSLLNKVLCKQEVPWTFEPLKHSLVMYGYRNKMEFTFGDEVKDGPLSLGLHKRNSFYDIVTVSDCQIMDEDYRKIVIAVRDYFASLKLPFFHRLHHTGYLRHLLVRKGAKTGEILIALITTSAVNSVVGETGQEPDLSGFADMLCHLQLDGKIVGILHSINDSVADVVRSDETRLLYGRDYFYEELSGLRFKITEFSFFQTNSLGAEMLYRTVREYVGELVAEETGEAGGRFVGRFLEETAGRSVEGNPEKSVERFLEENPEKLLEKGTEVFSGEITGKVFGKAFSDKVVFDLYSGTGTIAQMMAPVAKKVVGVEIVEEAVKAARENAELNGLHNCEFIAGDVLKVLDEIEEKPDFIILDPPRDGIHPKALKRILSYGVERMVYVSCKPTSLARDLESFLEAGYRVEKAVCCDMFPWTGNIETIVKLVRRHYGLDPGKR